MKKTLLILVAAVFAVTACDKQTYVDGTYTATFNEPHYGWTDYVSFTLTEDVISDVDFDAVNDADDLKSLDSAYNANMLATADVATNPETFMPQIEAAIANTAIVPEYVPIDAISGATGASDNANALMEAALNAAIDGELKDVVISYPEEK
jgi:major membrane immunogen (membrane-anchored lipoprotein)